MRISQRFLRDVGRERQDPERYRAWLIGLLLFNGIGAVIGGVGLLADLFGMPLDPLENTPFADYTIPAWILLVAVGGSSLGAAFALWRRTRYAAWAAMLAGVILLGWIVVEFVMIPGGWPAQLLFFLVAIAITWLGSIASHSATRRS